MNMSEVLFILVLLMVVVGPQRLPEYAEGLARWVRQLRRVALGAREQVRAELGPEFDEIDWTKLDPRQYDPRRIVRSALTDVWEAEPTKPVSTRPAPGSGKSTEGAAAILAASGQSAQVDPELVSSQADEPTPPPRTKAPQEQGRPMIPFDAEAT